MSVSWKARFRVLRTVVVVALLSTASACGRFGEPDGTAAKTPISQPEPTVGATGSAAVEEGTGVARRPLPVVSGEIYVRERIAFPAGTVVGIRVVRLGAGGSVTGMVAAVELPAPRHLPIPFEVVCDPDSIEEGGTYGLEAEIVRGGSTVFTTAGPMPVLAGGLPTAGVKLLLQRPG